MIAYAVLDLDALDRGWPNPWLAIKQNREDAHEVIDEEVTAAAEQGDEIPRLKLVELIEKPLTELGGQP